MWGSIDNVFGRTEARSVPAATTDSLVIRPARDADLAQLHDLAELDSAQPLTGRVLVAVVDGGLWAALAHDDGRVVADPFRPTASAVELLRLRAAQLRAAEGRPPRRGLALRAGRRARPSST
jgi:hypothetical protein